MRSFVWFAAGLLLGTLITMMLAINAGSIHAQDAQDVRQVIVDAAERHGASASQMLRVAACEAPGLNPYAVGDNGHSHGLYQLNDLATGLLGHFLSLGYDNAYDAEQAADYYARVAAGEFWPSVGVWRWSCK